MPFLSPFPLAYQLGLADILLVRFKTQMPGTSGTFASGLLVCPHPPVFFYVTLVLPHLLLQAAAACPGAGLQYPYNIFK